jgi:hypothetical protein
MIQYNTYYTYILVVLCFSVTAQASVSSTALHLVYRNKDICYIVFEDDLVR